MSNFGILIVQSRHIVRRSIQHSFCGISNFLSHQLGIVNGFSWAVYSRQSIHLSRQMLLYWWWLNLMIQLVLLFKVICFNRTVNELP